MLNITNGRVKYEDDYGSQINCFLVTKQEEIPIYQLEDDSRWSDISKESFPAIEGKDFKERGAWTSYHIETDKVLVFKFHIAHRYPDGEDIGQFYFASSPRKEDGKPKYVRSYTTEIVDKDDSIFKNKVVPVMMGGCIFLPENKLIKMGVNYNKKFCSNDKYIEMIKCELF